MRYTWKYKSPIGPITLCSDGEKLTGLWFDNQKYFGSTLTEDYQEKHLAIFQETTDWLDTYFKGEIPSFIPQLSLSDGTSFQKMVWDILLKIPYGQTITYGEIAMQVAEQQGKKTMSAQAVGGAVGHNPISIIVPCHRVIGSDGKLTGYAGGLDKKVSLLNMESGK